MTSVDSGVAIVAGIDLGGTAINYTMVDLSGTFLIEGLCEHPARVADGPDVCLTQIADGLATSLERAGVHRAQVIAVGLDSPGPASPTGVLSRRGSTNFRHSGWCGFDLRGALAARLGLPVTYMNDGNAAALWGHVAIFGDDSVKTSITCVVGTGLGGGVVIKGQAVAGARGFGGELGHVLLPAASIGPLAIPEPGCNCGRVGDLESFCSLTAIQNTLLPRALRMHSTHQLTGVSSHEAAKLVRGLAEAGDPMCREIFSTQARALGLFFDQMINVLDPDLLILGGGALETAEDFQEWFIGEVRAGMPQQREEQGTIPIRIMPNGDAAGARGAAINALRLLRREVEVA